MKNYTLKNFTEIFEKSDFKISDTTLNQLFEFYTLFNKYNDELDLSRIKDSKEIVIKHFIDSIYFTQLIDLPESLIDIGTGAGFPGLPLKIFLPDLKITLCEPRHKRVNFMRMAIDELKLENAFIYPHKLNEDSYFETDGIITRAFEDINSTLDRAYKFLKQSGLVIFLKGPGVESDLAEISDINKNAFEKINDIEYNLPIVNHKRRIVIFKKIASYREKTYLMMNEFEFNGKQISSSENKVYKNIKKELKKNKSISLISGKKLIKEYFQSHNCESNSLFIFDKYRENDSDFQNVLNKMEDSGNLFLLKKSLFNDLDILNTNQPLLLFQKSEIKEIDFSNFTNRMLAIPFQDPVNTGSVIRSAAAFGFKDILILDESCDPFHPKSIRTSGGTVLSCNFFKGPSIKNIKKECDKHEIDLITLDKSGEPISMKKWPETFILLPGIEGPGLPENLKDNAVSIKIDDSVESLNASVSVGIVLHSIKKLN